MKNKLLATIICLVAIPSFQGMASSIKKDNNPFLNGNATISVNGKTYNVVSTRKSNPATRAFSPSDVIREAEGESKLYQKAAAGTWVLQKQMELYIEDRFPAYVVWGDNNEVYVKDFLSTFMSDTYIKGELNGNTITFATNQLIDYIEDDQGDYGLALGVYKTRISGNDYLFDLDESITEFSITRAKDGSLTLVIPGAQFDGEEVPEYSIGYYYTDDGSFTGYTDFYQHYIPQELVPVEMPEGVTPEQYVFIDDFDYASLVNVAYTDTDIYIQGLDPMIPDGVIKARIDGNKAYVAQNQFIGIYLDIDFIYTKILLMNPEYNPDDINSLPYLMAPADMEFELTFNREEGWISSDNENILLSFQPNEDTWENSNCALGSFILRYQKDSLGIPANPTNLNYSTRNSEYYGYNNFYFTISNYSTGGSLLDDTYLLYRVFVNGEPLIFSEKTVDALNDREMVTYEGVPDEQIWLPFLFSNGEDITKWSSGEFILGIYTNDVQTLTVQTGYIYPGTKMTVSDLVTLDVATGEVTSESGVKEVIASPVEKVEYFTLAGVKVANPGKGIFIRKLIHANGLVTSDKVVLR